MAGLLSDVIAAGVTDLQGWLRDQGLTTFQAELDFYRSETGLTHYVDARAAYWKAEAGGGGPAPSNLYGTAVYGTGTYA